jgi:translation initiation factor IF-3
VSRSNKEDAINQNLRSNEQIRISPIRVIDQNEQQVGIIETHQALAMAREAGMDLVEVAPTARPPVCRIMDYGKWKYAQKKKHKKHHEQQLKEVRLRPKTDEHDRSIKVKRAINFFKKGDKVQFTIQFRGRERFHREIGLDILEDIAREFGEEKVKIEKRPSMDGRQMTMILAPVKGAFKPDAEEPAKDEADKDADNDTVAEEPSAPETESAEQEEATPEPSNQRE